MPGESLIVYALIDPRNSQVRYVGETIRRHGLRLSQHITTAKKQTTPPVNAWIRGLLDAGLSPEMLVIEEFADKQAMHECEVYWIEQFRALGAALLNIAPGGSTRVGYRHSAETRAKWSRERRGENAPMYGKCRTPEQRAMFSEITKAWIAENGHPMQGVKRSAETCRRISEGRKGIVPNVSEEGMESKRRFCRDRWLSDAGYRAKMVRPGLENPFAKSVLVDGVEYTYRGLASALGIHRNTVSRRIRELEGIGRELTAGDFASRRGKRQATRHEH